MGDARIDARTQRFPIARGNGIGPDQFDLFGETLLLREDQCEIGVRFLPADQPLAKDFKAFAP